MTTEEQNTLNRYQAEYDAALARYQEEAKNREVYQYGADQSWATGTWVYEPTGIANSTKWWVDQLELSKTALVRKEGEKNAALDRLNSYKEYLSKKAESDFAKENPAAFVTIVKEKISAARSQVTTKYLVWGAVALVIIGIAVVVIRKKISA